jgi:hypothetical protein
MTNSYFHILKQKYFETKTSKVQTCHMLTAQPSTCDMFGLIELYGRKLQSGWARPLCLSAEDCWGDGGSGQVADGHSELG